MTMPKPIMQVDTLEAVDDRGYFNSTEILACQEAGIIVTLPKPMTSGAKSEGRFGSRTLSICPMKTSIAAWPAGASRTDTRTRRMEKRRRYWTTACSNCPLKPRCTTGPERRITRWENDHVLEAVQQRLDANPNAMRQRRETVEHPSGTIKARMGATHFLMNTLPKVAAEMALHVLAYNLTHVMNIIGIKPLMAAGQAVTSVASNAPAASVNYLQAF